MSSARLASSPDRASLIRLAYHAATNEMTCVISGLRGGLGRLARIASRLPRIGLVAHAVVSADVGQRLVREAKGGNRSAFNRLARQHHAWLVRYLLFVLGNQGDAEDVAQEALLRAWLALGDLRDVDGFRPWLRQIATRQAFNHRRDRMTRERYADAASGPNISPGPGKALEARDLLDGVLLKLSYPYREVLVLRHVECLGITEISSLLGIGESAAKMRLKRAREAFEEQHARVMSEPNAVFGQDGADHE